MVSCIQSKIIIYIIRTKKASEKRTEEFYSLEFLSANNRGDVQAASIRWDLTAAPK